MGAGLGSGIRDTLERAVGTEGVSMGAGVGDEGTLGRCGQTGVPAGGM